MRQDLAACALGDRQHQPGVAARPSRDQSAPKPLLPAEPLRMRDKRDIVDENDGWRLPRQGRRVAGREEHIEAIAVSRLSEDRPAPTVVPPHPGTTRARHSVVASTHVPRRVENQRVS